MYEQVVQLIGSVGFPIVACIFMAVTMRKELQSLNSTVILLKESMEDIKTVIQEVQKKL